MVVRPKRHTGDMFDTYVHTSVLMRDYPTKDKDPRNVYKWSLKGNSISISLEIVFLQKNSLKPELKNSSLW